MKKFIFIFGLLLFITLNAKGQTAGNAMLFDGVNDFVMVPNHARLNPGTYELTFNAGNIPSGVYFYRLEAGDYMETRKMLLIK